MNSLILLKLLNVKHDVLAIARGRQKTVEPPDTADGLLGKPLSHCAKGHRFQCRLHLSCLPGFLNLRLMIESDVQRRQSGWRVAQRINSGDTGSQNKVVGNVIHTPFRQSSR